MPDLPEKRVCRQRARPYRDDSGELSGFGMNQHLVPRLQRAYWELRQRIPRIARREKLPQSLVEELLRQNSIPIRPIPTEVAQQKRRAA